MNGNGKELAWGCVLVGLMVEAETLDVARPAQGNAGFTIASLPVTIVVR